MVDNGNGDARPGDDKATRLEIITNLDRTFCVEAGAGTGKTTLLIRRILYLVASGADLSRIAAITFTEKAAVELKEKLYWAIDRWQSGESSAGEEQEMLDRMSPQMRQELPERLQQARRDLEVCQISTIHSFAARLLKTRPVEASVDPRFETADDTEMYFIKATAWHSLMKRKLTEGDSFLADFQDILEDTFEINPDNIRELAEDAYENRDLFIPAFPVTGVTYIDLENAIDAFRKKVPGMVDQFDVTLKDFRPHQKNDTVLPRLSVIENLRDELKAGGPAKDGIGLVVKFAEEPTEFEKKLVQKRTRQYWSGHENELQQLKEVVKALAREALEVIDVVARGLATIAVEYIDEVTKGKDRRGVLDFQDLLVMARALLARNPAVRKYFKRSYSHILVDEFQDTDPLQADIVFFLCEREYENADEAAEEWEGVVLEPGKLFIVGDPKQSIYGFRRADLRNYNKAKDVIERLEPGAIRYLVENHRSVPGILKWVNSVLGPAFSAAPPEAQQAQYEKLVAESSAADRLAEPAIVMRNREKEQLGSAANGRALEAELLVEDIARIKEELRIPCESGERAAAHGDIAVLFRALTDLDTYERALRDNGIPYRTEGGKDFFQRQEVLDLRNSLCAIENPYDGVSILGTLRSIFFAIPDDQVMRFRLNGGYFNYLLVSERDEGPVPDALRIIKELHQKRNERPLSATIQTLLDTSSALELKAAYDLGEQSLANFNKIIDAARDLEQRFSLTLGGFARWLSQMEKGGVQAEDPPSAEEAQLDKSASEPVEGCVRLMSIHKAKGLEFNAVIVAGISGERSSDAVVMLADYANGSIEFKVKSKGLTTRGYRDMRQTNEKIEDAEDVRLLYVATTRPRQCLVLHDFECERSDSWCGRVIGREESSKKESVLTEARQQCEVFETYPDLEELEARPMAHFSLHDVSDPEISEYNSLFDEWASSLEKTRVESTGGPQMQSATEGKRVPPFAEQLWPGLAMGRRIGTTLHRILEIVDQAPEPDSLRQLIETIAREEGVADRVEQISIMVHNVLGSDLWRRAWSNGTPIREMPFCIFDGTNYLVGTIDLVFREDGGVVIVDYKSDNITTAAVEGRAAYYRDQVAFYEGALASLLGAPLPEANIYFAAPNSVIAL